MKKRKSHLVVLGIVTACAIFSYAYLGVEDGSSGLSPLGWMHAAFFMPGVLLMHKIKGTLGNADLPLSAVISWVIFSIAAMGIMQIIHAVRQSNRRGMLGTRHGSMRLARRHHEQG